MNSIIMGGQWGDEGKGKIVDLLSKESNVVARYQGGANAGHTVYKDGKKLLGDYLRQKRKIIYFKQKGASEVRKIHINIIQSLKLNR